MKTLFSILLFVLIVSIGAQNVPDCIPVVRAVNNQINQVVVGGSTGSAIFAWQDDRAGNYNIYAARISSDGHMQWADPITGKLIIGGTSDKVNLSMVSDGLGGAFIAWQDNRNVNNDIFATRINANGDIYAGWGVSGIPICTDTAEQSSPKLVTDGAGGAFVVWSDNRSGDYDIYSIRMHADGTLTGNVDGTRMQLLPESFNQVNPSICVDGVGGAIIAYEQYTSASDYDIFAQRIDANCTNMWLGGGVPACIAANNQMKPQLVNDHVGSAIIVWEDNVNFTWDIYAQRVADGLIQWTANGIAIMAIALDQINPTIVYGGDYSAIIAWEHYLSATDCNIYAQKIWGGVAGTIGTLLWPATGVPVSTLNDSKQMHPQAVPDGAGGAIFAYEDGQNLAVNGYDIYGNHLNSAGSYTGAGVFGGYPVCTWDTDQTLPMLTYSTLATNNVIYAWLDHRNEATPAIHDIYTLGVEETFTYTVASHDVTGLVPGDLGAEIWLDGVYTGVYTGYVFGASGNLPMLAGTYTVVHPDFAGWVPVSFTITDIGQNYSTDFLGIRYILNVNSVPVTQDIFRDAANTGFQTNYTFYNRDVSVPVGNYTLQTAPAGFHWAPANNVVVAGNFNAGNNYTYTISFTLEADIPPVVYTYTVASHDVTGLVAGDLGAEIWFDGVYTGVHTGYVFGASGNLPMLAGTYTVVHPDFAGWVPVSFTITDLEQNYSTDFLGIRYILYVTSTPISQGIFRNTIDTGVLTSGSFYNKDVSTVVGNYTLQTPPFGFIWVPADIVVVSTDFNVGNDYTYTIHYDLLPVTLPVELSSFTAIVTPQNFVKLAWVTQSETGVQGYYIYRNNANSLTDAIVISPMITAANTSQEQFYSFTDNEIEPGMWYYWLQNIDIDGAVNFHGSISVALTDNNGGNTPPVPDLTVLGNIFPNPFNPVTTIPYNLSKSANVSITVYNLIGQLVRTLVSESKQGGEYHVSWNGKNDRGMPVPSGIYFIKMTADEFNSSQKVILVK